MKVGKSNKIRATSGQCRFHNPRPYVVTPHSSPLPRHPYLVTHIPSLISRSIDPGAGLPDQRAPAGGVGSYDLAKLLGRAAVDAYEVVRQERFDVVEPKYLVHLP